MTSPDKRSLEIGAVVKVALRLDCQTLNKVPWNKRCLTNIIHIDDDYSNTKQPMACRALLTRSGSVLACRGLVVLVDEVGMATSWRPVPWLYLRLIIQVDLITLSPSARQAGVVDHQVAPHLRPPEDQITWIWGQNLTWRHSSTIYRPGLHGGAPDNVVDYFKSSRSDLCSFWFLPQWKGTWKSWWAGGQVKLPSLVGSGYFPSFFSCFSFFPSSSPLPQLLIHLEVWLTSRSGSPPLQGSLCSFRVHNCVPDKYQIYSSNMLPEQGSSGDVRGKASI